MAPPVYFADDLEVGQSLDLGTWTPTAAEIVEFASAWDPQPFHLDDAEAARTRFRGLVASGMHTFSILHRLTVDAFYGHAAVIAGLGIRDGRLVRPVRPGMRLRGTLTVVELRMRDRDRAVVTTRGELHDDDDELVARVIGDGLMACRRRIE
jgi:acyl dehydratase